jgi:hypothetical protein
MSDFMLEGLAAARFNFVGSHITAEQADQR